MSSFDKAKDKAKQAMGEAKERTGKATDNESLEAEGKRDQLSGEAKEKFHDTRDKAAGSLHDAKERHRDDDDRR
ncbi:CsbD family protein [Glycomyces tarimensis]